MSRILYQNFDLLIECIDRESGLYRSRVIDSPAGQASTDFTLPFDEKDLKIFLLQVGRPRRSVRKIDSPEMEAARAFGTQLFDAAFGRQVATCLDRSIDAARMENARLRIRLRLGDVPELTDLPWEYLHDSSLRRFFSQSDQTPIVRYLELPWNTPPLQVQAPLRILTIISDPSDVQQLDVEQEWVRLNQALSDLTANNLVQVDRLDEASLPALQRQLRRTQYQILHFVGHGGFDPQTQTSVLIFEDEHGRSRRVDGDQLGTLLFDHPSLRLCLLNACEGARSDRTDLFSGVAQRLVQQGLPAVIAMQFEITDDAAVTLCHEFYSALADGYPVDAALAEGRKSIYVQGNDIEWGTPVLYMRSDDGLLFTIDSTAATQVEAAATASEPSATIPEPSATDSEPSATTPESSPALARQTPSREVESSTVLKPQLTKKPIDFEWLHVSTGKFQMGGNGKYDGKPVHTVAADGFYIAKTPITNQQYKIFVDAVGYHMPKHWKDGHIPTGKEMHPVVHVSWCDALAFCQWADVRLPTEAEWEKAAAWDAETKTKRIYPWGNQDPSRDLCNIGEFKIGDTTPVDRYPDGASAYGCLDMAGNVWEWTSTLWSDYPYDPHDGRESLEDTATARVVRGGSFDLNQRNARCAFRGLNHYLDYFIGFRVACAPI